MRKRIQALENFDLPIVPMHNVVIFPGETIYWIIRKDICFKILDSTKDDHYRVIAIPAKQDEDEGKPLVGLFSYGVVCCILDVEETFENSDESMITIKGLYRARIENTYVEETLAFATGSVLSTYSNNISKDDEMNLSDRLKSLYRAYMQYLPNFRDNDTDKIYDIDNISRLSDSIAYHSQLPFEKKEQLLEDSQVNTRVHHLIEYLQTEIDVFKTKNQIHRKVRNELDQEQKEYFLRKEMKAISEELGDTDNPYDEIQEYKKKINELKCSDEVSDKLLKEADKLINIPSSAHEGIIVRNYLDKCLQIPFGNYSAYSIDLEKSRRVLDKDHYALDTVKDRIIEALAVYKRNPDFSGQIICLYGPPGVGKTSIVKSLAKSMNREYVRISLGGVNDEADIRGHRRTYVGSMAGRIVEAIIKAKVMNPIILLDEIDKVGNDYKGDPAAALLEALDPEQNNSFYDHYIDFPIDLSKVMFITTANDVSTIHPALRDRMEVIEMNSYTYIEKYHIAKEFLLKKQMKKHALLAREFKIDENAYESLIDCYTKEAGVRELEKQIATLCRKAVYNIENGKKSIRITKNNISNYLGVPKFESEELDKESKVGVINGLAWTSVGGTLLPIEVSSLVGTGNIVITGNLGDVMQESAKTALSYVRANSDYFGIDPLFYKDKDIHVHAMEGAIPKDGPSAGMAITAAIVSELTNNPIKRDIAMTGEISLKGRALAIGGLKEKSMAAYKAKCSAVIMPRDNVKDLVEIPDEVKDNIRFIPVSDFKGASEYVFEKAFQNTNKVDDYEL